ncbi:MAG: 50S ribosome-binding GTPase [Nostoc sp. TH1S01]|nr:50S ribosome-binding GTPase [Nostoc sp. TH1S01]
MSQELKELRDVIPTIIEELKKHPPTIGLIGVSGVGKSSTINRLFKTDLPTSDTVACTKEFEQKDIELTCTQGELKNSSVPLRVIDAPGLGEDIKLDPKYLRMYQENLGSCDVIVWVLNGRNRAIALDQMYLQQLQKFHTKIVFALNQIDLIEPLNWNIELNIPSQEQEKNIKVILEDRKKKLSSVIKNDVKMVEYSSKTGYRLEELFKTIIDSVPKEKTWIFNSLKNFSYRDYTPEVLLRVLDERDKKSLKQQDESGDKSWLERINPFRNNL